MKTLITALLTALILVTGCAENSSSLVIVQNQMPETGCTASNTVEDTFISHGILDLGASRYGVTPQYYAWFVVDNNLRTTVESHGIELNNVELREAHIDLKLAQAGGSLGSDVTSFADYTFVTVPPGETRSVQVNLIPPNVAQRLNISEGQFIEVFAKVQLVGERGGTEIVTNSINFPVTLCYGCLVENIGPCDTATFPETVEQGHSCNMSQDSKLHCCYDSAAASADNAYRCPAVQGTSTAE